MLIKEISFYNRIVHCWKPIQNANEAVLGSFLIFFFFGRLASTTSDFTDVKTSLLSCDYLRLSRSFWIVDNTELHIFSLNNHDKAHKKHDISI